MRIIVDADGCPVVRICARVAVKYGIECIAVCDTSHIIEIDGVKTVTVSKGNDSVDFALVNMISAGDIAVTQDYGLAAMCLARGVKVLNQDGKEYTPYNIEGLLLRRHEVKKLRRSGGHPKGQPKRDPSLNEMFERSLIALIENNI